MTNAQDPNATAIVYLQEYCDPERQRDFAILLDGPWGAGKTYFIKNFVKAYPRHLYVSLYGVASTQQIDDELFRQLHPVLASAPMRLIGRVAKGLIKGTIKIDLDNDGKDDGSATIALPDGDLKKELSDPDGRLLIFDDLERCSLPVNEVLGYINAFVEHVGLKAIIVANEGEIRKRAELDSSADKRYAEIKEKLIGQTLRITSAPETALRTFMEGIADAKVKELLLQHASDVIAIHRQSETNNLRLLKQALWDYERVAQHFQAKHWENADAMKSVLGLLLAVSIEHRSGRLHNEQQVRRLMDSSLVRAMERQSGKEKCVEDEIEQRYRMLTLDSSVMSADIVAGAVLDGRAVKSEILDALSQSQKFAKPADVPLWLRAWNYHDLTDDAAEAVATEFMTAFGNREFKERGVVFHAFGIIREYARMGLVPLAVDCVEAACRSYVDDLASRNELEIDLERSWLNNDSRSYAHHGYMSLETPEFRAAVSYYKEKSANAVEQRYPIYLEELLNDLASGGDDFLFDLAPNNVRNPRFLSKPILTAISPADFLTRVLQTPVNQQRSAFGTLKLRHQFPAGEAIASEKPWIAELHALLSAEILKARPVTAHRLQYYLDEYLAPLVGASDSSDNGGADES